MLRKSSVVASLALLAGLLPSVASAQDYGYKAGDLDFTLTGTGANNKKFDAGSFGVGGSIGYMATKDLELVLRQTVNYSDNNNGTAWQGSTRLAADYHFDLSSVNLPRLRPFIGANIGYVYGDNVSDTWEAAPEIGLKFFVNNTTYLFGQMEYEFFFRNGGGVGNAFKNGQFVYQIGIGFRVGR